MRWLTSHNAAGAVVRLNVVQVPEMLACVAAPVLYLEQVRNTSQGGEGGGRQ